MILIKEQTIHKLHKARTAHIRSLNSVKLLVSGLQFQEDQFQLGQTETAFGKWFHEEAMLFSNSNSRIQLETMEKLLLQLHDHFTTIYQIFFGTSTGGVMGFFGKKHKPSDAEKELAKRLYDEMVGFSDQLKQKLRVFESQLNSMPEEKFTELIYTPEETPLVAAIKEDTNQYHFGARGH